MSESMNPVNGRQHWLLTKTVTGAGNSLIIDLPFEPKGYTIQVVPTDGLAKAGASIDALEFEDWPVGDISACTLQGIMFPIRYIKLTNNTSTSTVITVWGY